MNQSWAEQMLNNVMNTNLHPIETTGVVNWMLWRWQIDPGARLMLLLPAGDGEKAMNRIRVQISKARKMMKQAGIKDMQHFGINQHVGVWNEDADTVYDVVYINRFVDKSHLMGEIFAQMDLGIPKTGR